MTNASRTRGIVITLWMTVILGRAVVTVSGGAVGGEGWRRYGGALHKWCGRRVDSGVLVATVMMNSVLEHNTYEV
jgi:hypothetical protein